MQEKSPKLVIKGKSPQRKKTKKLKKRVIVKFYIPRSYTAKARIRVKIGNKSVSTTLSTRLKSQVKSIVTNPKKESEMRMKKRSQSHRIIKQKPVLKLYDNGYRIQKKARKNRSQTAHSGSRSSPKAYNNFSPVQLRNAKAMAQKSLKDIQNNKHIKSNILYHQFFKSKQKVRQGKSFSQRGVVKDKKIIKNKRKNEEDKVQNKPKNEAPKQQIRTQQSPISSKETINTFNNQKIVSLHLKKCNYPSNRPNTTNERRRHQSLPEQEIPIKAQMFMKYTKSRHIGKEQTLQIQKILTGNGLQFQDQLIAVNDELQRYQNFMREELNNAQKLRQEHIKKTYSKTKEEEKLQDSNKPIQKRKLFENIQRERILSQDFINEIDRRKNTNSAFSQMRLFIKMKKHLKHLKKRYANASWYQQYLQFYKEQEEEKDDEIFDRQLTGRSDLDRFTNTMPDQQWSQVRKWIYMNQLWKEKKEKDNDYKIDTFEIMRGNKRRLSKYDMFAIIKEYQKGVDQSGKPVEESDINYEKIDKIVKELRFFSKYKKNERITILRKSTVQSYYKGKVIFRQGQADKNVYVILQGSVNIKKKAKNSLGFQENKLKTVYYDGEFFGQVSMIGKLKNIVQFRLQQEQKKKDIAREIENQDPNSPDLPHIVKEDTFEAAEHTKETTQQKKKEAGIRESTAIAAENSEILVFNQEIYEKVLLVVMENELHNRIMVLNRLHLFEKADPMLLSPLASFLSTQEYKMGDTIVYANKPPNRMVMVSSGNVSKVVEIVSYRQRKPSIFTKRLQPPLRNFQFQMEDYHIREETGTQITIKKKRGRVQSFYDRYPLDKEKRVFNQDVVPELCTDKQIAYKNQILVRTLHRGDYECCQPLFMNEIRPVKGPYFSENEIWPVHFKLVASSAKVIVYSITREQIQMVNDELRLKFLDGLFAKIDRNRFDKEVFKKRDLFWNDFKEALQDEVILENYKNRNTGEDNKTFKKY